MPADKAVEGRNILSRTRFAARELSSYHVCVLAVITLRPFYTYARRSYISFHNVKTERNICCIRLDIHQDA